MIRHEAIAELSRDHHKALLQAIALKRATDETAAQVAANFNEFFEREGNLHFQIEDQVLLPTYARYAGLEVTVDPIVVQVMHEHVELRALAMQVADGEADAVLLRELGSRLDDHVRLEERKLFPKIQERLSEDQLVKLAAAVLRAETRSDGD